MGTTTTMDERLVEDPGKNVVVFVGSISDKYYTAIKKLSQRLNRSLRIVVLTSADPRTKRSSTNDNEVATEEVEVDLFDEIAVSQAVKSLQKNLLLVTCPLEKTQVYFKRVIPHVPYVATPTESSIDHCTDKGRMRQLLYSYDHTLSPRAVVVFDATPETTHRICDEFPFPLMVKPTSLAASRLVSKVGDENELRCALEQGFKTLRDMYAASHRLGREAMVVEEFVEGDLFSADAYVDAAGKVYVLPFNRFFNGTKAGSDSFQVYQGETYHTLSDEEQQLGRVAVEKAIHAVGLRSSVAHVELFHQKGNWKIVELGARPGGWRQEMYQLSYGIDHAFNELLIKIGLKPDMPSALSGYVITFSVHAPKTGVLESITGIEEARAHPSLHTLYVKHSVGDKVVPSAQGGGAIVDGLMYHRDSEQLRQAVELIRSIVHVRIV